jgi:hypothetical protein
MRGGCRPRGLHMHQPCPPGPAGALGLYLALTGARLTSPADLLHARLATHYVPRDALPRLRAALAAVPLLAPRRAPQAPAPAPAAAADAGGSARGAALGAMIRPYKTRSGAVRFGAGVDGLLLQTCTSSAQIDALRRQGVCR